MNRPLAQYTWQELIQEIQIRVLEHGIVFIKGGPEEETKSTDQLNIEWEKTNPERKENE